MPRSASILLSSPFPISFFRSLTVVSRSPTNSVPCEPAPFLARKLGLPRSLSLAHRRTRFMNCVPVTPSSPSSDVLRHRYFLLVLRIMIPNYAHKNECMSRGRNSRSHHSHAEESRRTGLDLGRYRGTGRSGVLPGPCGEPWARLSALWYIIPS